MLNNTDDNGNPNGTDADHKPEAPMDVLPRYSTSWSSNI